MSSHPIIDSLLEDHRVMHQMFSVIDEEIGAFTADGQPDFDKLLAAVEYCHAYPGALHHPREDIVFKQLTARKPAAVGPMGDMEEEHRILADYTRRFKSAVEKVLRDEIVPKGEVARLAEDYTTFLKRHMATEEATFFPAAVETLTDADWRAVVTAVDALGDDPGPSASNARISKLRDIAGVS